MYILFSLSQSLFCKEALENQCTDKPQCIVLSVLLQGSGLFWTYFHIVGIYVIWADHIGISVLKENSGVINFKEKTRDGVRKLCIWWQFEAESVGFNGTIKLTWQNVLVSVFALIFGSLAFFSALFHLCLLLLKSLQSEEDIWVTKLEWISNYIT